MSLLDIGLGRVGSKNCTHVRLCCTNTCRVSRHRRKPTVRPGTTHYLRKGLKHFFSKVHSSQIDFILVFMYFSFVSAPGHFCIAALYKFSMYCIVYCSTVDELILYNVRVFCVVVAAEAVSACDTVAATVVEVE